MNIGMCAGSRVAVAAVGGLLLSGVGWAETIDCSGTKVSRDRHSESVLLPGDRPDRKMMQYVRVDVISSPWGEIDGTDQTVLVQQNQTGKMGTSEGFGDFALRNGEKLWYKFQATYRVLQKGDTRESRYQGIFHFIGGTGRYQGIRGDGHFQGTVTSGQLSEEFVCTATF